MIHAGPNGGGHFDCWRHSVNSPPPPSAITNAITFGHNYERVCYGGGLEPSGPYERKSVVPTEAE
eukprot:392238-Pleurochrysis_carterae.AAC.2